MGICTPSDGNPISAANHFGWTSHVGIKSRVSRIVKSHPKSRLENSLLVKFSAAKSFQLVNNPRTLFSQNLKNENSARCCFRD
jgi:hypothetical protein